MEELNRFFDIMKSMFTSEDGNFELGLFIKMAIGFMVLGYLYLKFKKATKGRNKGVQETQSAPNYDDMIKTREEQAKSINGSFEVDRAVIQSLKNRIFDRDYANLKTSYGDNAESIYDLLSDFLSSSNDIYRNLNKKLKDSEIAQITGVASVKENSFLATYNNGDVKIEQGIYSIELSMSDLNGCSVDDLQRAFNRL
ncbi:hypothetical protein [Staphylococcus epidermidis]|uniref:hypothetical protein n=1 Tax=Staphylococcus epidermidis TaxID=1282 RepID=UPI000B7A3101|nr:hypothetical protein [Staphylococcus epidermidis]OXE84686.1 hypothetical protein ATC33_06935 [Staphylococcus epidermidis]